MDPTSPRFIADCMLGRLARWLRLLGCDAAYERRIGDDALVARARAEGRVLLTRDTRLLKRRALPEHLYIESETLLSQLRQVLEAYHLDPSGEGRLSRCPLCNAGTVGIEREEARGEVPPYVFRTQERFARCPECRRIYWRATHVKGILDRLHEMQASPARGGDP